uniref:FXYD domain-containing ion transport regulator n=1 Tax=Vombatus ursinus TaxID=29139 RepID=A0A4X2KL61_VOMUR
MQLKKKKTASKSAPSPSQFWASFTAATSAFHAPGPEPDHFYYDYDFVRIVRLTPATTMFVLGILIILRKKVKCRQSDSSPRGSRPPLTSVNGPLLYELPVPQTRLLTPQGVPRAQSIEPPWGAGLAPLPEASAIKSTPIAPHGPRHPVPCSPPRTQTYTSCLTSFLESRHLLP